VAKKKKGNDKQLLIKSFIMIGVILIVLCLGWFIDSKDKFSLVGEYVNVSNGEKFVLTVNEWTKGEKEKLECNLWTCSGYSHGTYKVDKDLITFNLNPGVSYKKYEIKEENGETYLILKESDKVVDKYKKVK